MKKEPNITDLEGRIDGMAIPAGLEPATLCLEVRRELRKLMKLREFCFTRLVQKSLVLLNFWQGL
jgi:hypothetical protein